MSVFDLSGGEATRRGSADRQAGQPPSRTGPRAKGGGRTLLQAGGGFLAIFLIMVTAFAIRGLLSLAHMAH